MGGELFEKTLLKDVLHDTFPVLTGYVVLGFGCRGCQLHNKEKFTDKHYIGHSELHAFSSACVCVINKKTVSFTA